MRNTKKGFTLVELLVVIAILAILATVSVVGYTNYINNANNSKAQQELTQLRDYAMAYDLSHDGTGAKDGKVNATEAQKAIDDCDIEGVALVGNNVTYTVNGKVIAHWDITTGTVTLGAPTAGGEEGGEENGENPAITTCHLSSTGLDGNTYYFNGTSSSGKGGITTNASEAAVVYKENVEGGFYLYILDGETKSYINIIDDSKGVKLLDTAQLLEEKDGAIKPTDSNRALTLYHSSGTPTDIRTYDYTTAYFTNNTAVVLVSIE